MEVAKNSEESSPGSLTGMSRAAKLFIKIDKDGYLVDSLAISDVVNFDCIESIVTSAKRVVSLFFDVTPRDVDITGLFYYKKRARSLRMNPVPLLTTTDGFRAVAEHPSGEIPLGIEWQKKTSKFASSQPTGEKRSRSGSPVAEVLEKKKTKLDVPSKYKTYMPTSKADTSSLATTTSVSADKLEPPELVIRQKKEILEESKPANSQKSEEKSQVHLIPSVVKILNGEDTSKRTPRPPTKSNYHWTGDVSCEVIMTYNGITERQKVKPRLGRIIQNLVKGDYTTLRADVQHNLNTETKQETLNTVNFRGDEKQKQITYLNEAKTEVFKVLSALCMSKARFKDLLDWMKTLKLEEGNQGKYYLSERNVIGGGLRVMYDTDEQVASKLNSIQRIRGKAKEKTKQLYPVQSTLNPSKQGNYMIMVPSSNTTGGVTPIAQTGVMVANSKSGDQQVGIAPVMQAGQSLVPLVSTVQNPNQPHPAWSKEASILKTTESKSSFVSILNQAPKSVTSMTQTETFVKQSPKHTPRQPNILRSKSHKIVPPSGDPVPMHLFRSYITGNMPDNTNIENYNSNDDTNPETTLPTVIIKKEPMDYDSDNNDNEDNSKHSQDEPHDKFKDVLNSDAHMPVDNESNDLNMELVIKTEPVDDFDS
ncbi:uncharacterized protein LOC132725593 isoform X2 [Ruditapes philippinarum]|uniref:uncharacterized protein LOC132725593 isoform X2 n=1 Tax=Ruditapes philippinarum TaxID=129788 RepID=UPI00295ABD00|nr:uncharacterized protein LOC132725593 isoform X2 [Ruditapes philippinarum]